jgi:SAM-dependent methyltransferase
MRLSFGSIAAMYDRARPSYADAAVDWTLPPGTQRVLDLAAGTGKLTAMLATRGLDVVAVDPSEPMLAQLRHNRPDVDARLGSAEAIGLPDNDVDAVVIGSALHWFERPSADREIARVLRPGGVVGVFQNRRDVSVQWLKDLESLLDVLTPKHRHPDQQRALRIPFKATLFDPPEVAQFRFSQELDADGLAELLASRSYLIALSPDERTDVLDQVRALARTHPDLAGRERFELPYLTVVSRSTRRRR